MPSNQFADLTEPFRPELVAYCYRLLGSIQDAEDLVQDTSPDGSGRRSPGDRARPRAVGSLAGTGPGQPARRRPRRHSGPAEDDLAEPGDPDQRDLINRFVDVFVRADPDALVALLRADVELEMPPIPLWFTGQPAVTGFLSRRVMRPGRWRMVPTRANAQPAVVVYRQAGVGRYEDYGVQVLTVTGGRIARITSFNDLALAPVFGLAWAGRTADNDA